MSRDFGVLVEKCGCALRGTFILDPDGVVQFMSIQNVVVGRSVLETLRLLEAFQAAAETDMPKAPEWKLDEEHLVDISPKASHRNSCEAHLDQDHHPKPKKLSTGSDMSVQCIKPDKTNSLTTSTSSLEGSHDLSFADPFTSIDRRANPALVGPPKAANYLGNPSSMFSMSGLQKTVEALKKVSG